MGSEMKSTISSLPSMIAIRSPVLVPHIRSNTSQGRIADIGAFGLSTWCWRLIWATSSFSIYREEIPLTPPPSSDKIRNGASVSIPGGLQSVQGRKNLMEESRNTHTVKVQSNGSVQLLNRRPCRKGYPERSFAFQDSEQSSAACRSR